jgi:hypothetical protein
MGNDERHTDNDLAEHSDEGDDRIGDCFVAFQGSTRETDLPRDSRQRRSSLVGTVVVVGVAVVAVALVSLLEDQNDRSVRCRSRMREVATTTHSVRRPVVKKI